MNVYLKSILCTIFLALAFYGLIKLYFWLLKEPDQEGFTE